MSLDLLIGTGPKISGTATDGANVDSFCSFWLGYKFTIAQQNTAVNIDEAFLAVYCSHDSSRPIPGLGRLGPQLGEFGAVPQAIEIKDRAGNKLNLNSLIYTAAEDVECANQAMQLHLFRFDPARKSGIAGWVNDSGWKATALPAATHTADSKPYWKRKINYGKGDRYCHYTWRHRNIAGIQAAGATMPFGAGSLFQHWLTQHGKTIPSIQLTALGDPNGKNPETQHWTDSFGVQNITAGTDPRGVAVIAHGAFTALEPADLMTDRWLNLFGPNSAFALCRELASVASAGSPRPHSLGALAVHSKNCVVPPSNDTPHEFFYVRLL